MDAVLSCEEGYAAPGEQETSKRTWEFFFLSASSSTMTVAVWTVFGAGAFYLSDLNFFLSLVFFCALACKTRF